MNQEDGHLIRQAQQNHADFDELYNKYVKKVFNYFWYRLKFNKEIAEDLTQETFTRAFEKLASFEVRNYSYLTYLLKIAHNLLVNYYRDHKLESSIDDLPEIPTTIKQRVDDSFDIEKLWQNVEKLPLAEKDVVLLRYRRDLEIKKIAKIVGKTENAVKLLLSRARKKLRKYADLEPIKQLPDKPLPPNFG